MSEYKGKTILNLNEASEYLGLAKPTLLKLLQKKEITFYRNSKKLIYFKVTELDKWMTQNPIDKSN